MGAMWPEDKAPCWRCEHTVVLPDNPDARKRLLDKGVTCKVCDKLGDRSLLWYGRAYQAATTDEERAAIKQRFAAARGRSWMYPDVLAALQRGEPLPPGILQWQREKER